MKIKRIFSEKESLEGHSDGDLIALYKKKKDLEVLGFLYKRYLHLVYGVALKYLKNKQDSEDATMQIFEKLIREIDRFEIQNFGSWLHVITRNFCLMKLRTYKSVAEFDAEFSKKNNMEIQDLVHPNHEPSLEEHLSIMENCMEELPTDQKVCIRMFYLEELTYKEIVSKQGFDMKKVKSYLQNGKRNLKNCMEAKIGKEE